MYLISQPLSLLLTSLLAVPATFGATVSPRAGGTCTFTDFKTFDAGKKSCSKIILKNVAVPAGVTLDLATGVNNLNVEFQGKTTFGYKEWAGPLINFGGSGLTVNVANGAIIDGDGARWWDGQGGNGGKTKPKFVSVHNVNGGSINGLHITNSPVHVFSISGCKNVHLDHITIENINGEKLGAHNTDGFDIGKSDFITISNSKVDNQDDCIAVNSGTNLHFTGMTCNGGHGMSIGSIGNRDDNTVQNVIFEHSTISNSDNGARIKTIAGAPSGLVQNVTYSDITLSNIADFGIDIRQNYMNSGSKGDPTNGIKIKQIHFSGIKGSVASSAQVVNVLCGVGSCTDWTVQGITVTGGKGNTCKNAPTKSCL
ncbi:unnamed protein product [Sympodiomycopsis kandeliae]